MVYPLYYCATIARRLVVARIICPWITSGEIALHKMHGPLITTTTTTTTTSFQVSHRNIRSIINERSAYRCIRRWADNKLPGRLSMLSFFSFPTLLPPPPQIVLGFVAGTEKHTIGYTPYMSPTCTPLLRWCHARTTRRLGCELAFYNGYCRGAR